jgi:hypothetical protein
MEKKEPEAPINVDFFEDLTGDIDADSGDGKRSA